MRTGTFSELVRAYFAATSTLSSRAVLRDPMPEEGGGVRVELVEMGAERLEDLLRRAIAEETCSHNLLKILYAPNATDIVLTLPIEEIVRPFFTRLLELAEDHPLAHYYYGFWLLNVGSSKESDAIAASHYRRAAELHIQMASKLQEWAIQVISGLE